MAKSGCLIGWIQDVIGGSRGAGASKRPPAYRCVTALLSRAEVSFYHVLRQCLPPGHTLFVKVRLADVLKVATKRSDSPSQYSSDFNRIKSKHIDFLICDADTLRPMLAIELDDRSHQKQSRQDRDRFIDRAYRHADLPLLHIRASRNYHAATLTKQIKSALTGNTTNPPRRDGGAI